MLFCTKPFENIEIDTNFDVFTCCPFFNDFYRIGNVLDESLEVIWNGERVQKLRQNILNGDFSLCNLKTCVNCKDETIDKSKYSIVCKDYPKMVWLLYDRFCNANCIMCRDKHILNNKEEVEKFNNIAEKNILPMLKSAEVVQVNGSGETFYSEHSLYMIKRIRELYPNIKFSITTNGLLSNKQKIYELGLQGQIATLYISVHAATEETYKKITRAGSLKIVLDNVKQLKEMQKNGEIGPMEFVFIVSSLNYEEIPLFLDIANEYEIKTIFRDYVKRHDTEMGKEYEKYYIFDEKHKDFKKFKKVLSDERLIKYKDQYSMSPLLSKIKDDAQKEKPKPFTIKRLFNIKIKH